MCHFVLLHALIVNGFYHWQNINTVPPFYCSSACIEIASRWAVDGLTFDELTCPRERQLTFVASGLV